VLDLMIHDVDLVRALVGQEVAEIRASGIPVLTPMVDIANARITFSGGAVANLTASRVSLERKRKLRLFQRSGYLSLDLGNGTGEFLRLREEFALPMAGEDLEPAIPGPMDFTKFVERHVLTGDGVEPLRAELENFRDAVLGRGVPAVTGADGLSALELSLSIEEHIRQGQIAAGV
jgi:predicted dehydrogenase